MGDVDEVGDVGDEYDHREECAELVGGLWGCEGKGETDGGVGRKGRRGKGERRTGVRQAARCRENKSGDTLLSYLFNLSFISGSHLVHISLSHLSFTSLSTLVSSRT